MTTTKGPTTSVDYWDDVASRTWGRYISEIEAHEIRDAATRAPAPRRALDAGCGGGRWTRLLLDLGWSVTGYDVEAEVVDQFASRNPEATAVLASPDQQRLPVEDGSVSLVLTIEVQAVAHADWFPAEAHRVLVPDGRLVAVVWNRRSLRGWVTDALSRLRTGEPHRFYRTSYRATRRTLQDAGFRIENARGLCWFPFGRFSNSRLVPLGVALERLLRLGRLPSLSPWVIITAVSVDPLDRSGPEA